MGYSPWDRKESDTTEATQHTCKWLKRASLMAQQVKNLPAVQETWETWVQSVGQEDPLEEENGNPSRILV